MTTQREAAVITLQLPGISAWDATVIADEDIRITAIPMSGRTVSGYGPRIPTQYMVRHNGRWYRVRVVCYGNAGSAYILVNGMMAWVVEVIDPE